MRTNNTLWNNIQYSAQYQLSAAYCTKVPIDWRDINFTPDFSRFYLIVDGEGMIELDGKRYYPKPGQLYLLPAGVRQSYSTINENTFLKYWVHFSAKVGSSSLVQLMKLPAFVEVRDWEAMEQRFEALRQAFASDSISSVFRQQSLLLEILASFVELSEPNEVRLHVPEVMEKMDAVLSHIETHLSESFTIEQLAAHFHYHPNHLIRVFKRYTGYAPIQYINHRKIEAAKISLISSGQSVTDIASTVGMELHYFSRVFKETTGFTPSFYRKTQQTD